MFSIIGVGLINEQYAIEIFSLFGRVMAVTFMIAGGSALTMALVIRCPACGERTFLYGEYGKISLPMKKPWKYVSWFMPLELFRNEYFCCKCKALVKGG